MRSMRFPNTKLRASMAKLGSSVLLIFIHQLAGFSKNTFRNLWHGFALGLFILREIRVVAFTASFLCDAAGWGL